MSNLKFTPIKGKISGSQLILIALLSLAIAVVALPNYFSYWDDSAPSWANLPKVAEIDRLKALRQQPLNYPGWRTLNQQEVRIGGNQWSVQVIENSQQQQATIFLMPQDYYKNHPQVEWVDLSGIERWKTDAANILTLKSVDSTPSTIKARFFRAWNEQTYAVVQWYAWPGGGHFAPSRWFWLDQWAQLRRDRLPWIAVSAKITIDPLGNLADAEAQAKLLAQTIHNTLNQDVFSKKVQQNHGKADFRR